MIYLLTLNKPRIRQEDICRFITKNIQKEDVIIFSKPSIPFASKHYLAYCIETQCSTGWPCPFTNKEIEDIIENSIITKEEEIDFEYLHSRDIKNIVLFGYENLKPEILKKILYEFPKKANILGISIYSEPLPLGLLNSIKKLKRNGLNDKQIRIIKRLENEFSLFEIDTALTCLYTNDNHELHRILHLDQASEFWLRGKNPNKNKKENPT